MRNAFIIVVCILSGFFLASCAQDPRPDVVILVLDTTRADKVGGEWDGVPLTPNLDALDSESVLFTRALAPAPWTVPSHASLFTGLYPHTHGAQHGNFRLAPEFETLAERLAKRGYETVGITCNPWLHNKSGMQQGFDRFMEIYKLDEGEKDKGARLATEKAIRWLEEGENQEKPFLLFINYLEPHLPFEPPARILDRLAWDAGSDAWTDFSVERAERVIAGLDSLS
jgi:hypothetical protein